MRVSKSTWNRYISKLRKLSEKAADEMERYIEKFGGLEAVGDKGLVEYSFFVAKKYGEGAAALSAQFYDSIAQLQGVAVSPAIPAETPTLHEMWKDMVEIEKKKNETLVSREVSKKVRRNGLRTIVNNSIRDGAEVAWIPSGDSCPFCIMLASRGWQNPSKKSRQIGGWKDHIHQNCDCAYAVRFNPLLDYASYDPDKALAEYEAAEGDTWEEKLNSMRRKNYANNAEDINAQKRAAYAARKKAESEK